MTTITLKKKGIQDFIILKNAVFQIMEKRQNEIQNSKKGDPYFNNVLIIDVLINLVFRFRAKIENQKQPFSNFNLRVYEAVILLQCFNDFQSINEYEIFSTRKYYLELHEQLINL